MLLHLSIISCARGPSLLAHAGHAGARLPAETSGLIDVGASYRGLTPAALQRLGHYKHPHLHRADEGTDDDTTAVGASAGPNAGQRTSPAARRAAGGSPSVRGPQQA